MRKLKPTTRSTGGHKATRSSRNNPPADAPAPYAAYAIAADGSRRLLDARHIVVDVGLARMRIELQPIAPMLAGRLNVRVEGEAILIVGPGDASSISLGVELFRSAEGALESS